MTWLTEGIMKKREDRFGIAQEVFCQSSDTASARFKSFCENVLGEKVDEVPSEQSIFTRQSFSIVFFATIIFTLTNGFYLVKNILFNTMITIDMIPLYMIVAGNHENRHAGNNNDIKRQQSEP